MGSDTRAILYVYCDRSTTIHRAVLRGRTRNAAPAAAWTRVVNGPVAKTKNVDILGVRLCVLPVVQHLLWYATWVKNLRVNNFRLFFFFFQDFAAKHLCSAKNATLNPI